MFTNGKHYEPRTDTFFKRNLPDLRSTYVGNKKNTPNPTKEEILWANLAFFIAGSVGVGTTTHWGSAGTPHPPQPYTTGGAVGEVRAPPLSWSRYAAKHRHNRLDTVCPWV